MLANIPHTFNSFQQLSNGETIAYSVTNQEYTDTLLLVHGNLTEKSSWTRLISELSKHPFKIICIDQRGFGNSTYNKKIQRIEDLSSDLKDFCECLQLQDFTICGWSLGGVVSLQFIAENPHLVKRVVLVASGHVAGYPLIISETITSDESTNPQNSQNNSQQGIQLNAHLSIQQESESIIQQNTSDNNNNNNNNNNNQTGEQLRQQTVTTRNVKSIEEVYQHPKVVYFKQILSNQDKSTLKSLSNKILFNGLYQPSLDSEEFDQFATGSLKQQNYSEIAFALSQFNMTSSGTNLLDKITCPVLIYHGVKDLVIPVSDAISNAELIGKNKCKIVLKDEDGHCPPYDSPQDLTNEIIQFCQPAL